MKTLRLLLISLILWILFAGPRLVIIGLTFVISISSVIARTIDYLIEQIKEEVFKK